jgi:site-specific DNA-methyltransferase (adenine-specific)
MPDSKGASSQNNYSNGHIYRGQSLQESNTSLEGYREWYNDDGSAARYFYCAKASQRDRDEGLEAFQTQRTGDLQGGRKEGSAGSIMQNADGGTRVNPYAGTGAPKKNIHPTVKPTDLMQYLIRLVTPKGGTVLDPFNGSGSTGKAAMYENNDRNADYTYIGIDLSADYLTISDARIQYAIKSKDIVPVKTVSAEQKKVIGNQMSLFDMPQ